METVITPTMKHCTTLILVTMSVSMMAASPDLTTKVQEIIYQNGDTALLPCDISNSNPGDRVTLLLWYKEDSRPGRGGMGSPIYRIDARTNNHDIAIGEFGNIYNYLNQVKR